MSWRLSWCCGAKGMGFFDGWGTMIQQMEEVALSLP